MAPFARQTRFTSGSLAIGLGLVIALPIHSVYDNGLNHPRYIDINSPLPILDFLSGSLPTQFTAATNVINVAFLGVATVTGFQFGTSTQFNLSGSALLAIVANLIIGFVAGLCLRTDVRPFWGTTRAKWVFGFVVIGVLLFAFSVATVYQPSPDKSNSDQGRTKSQGVTSNRLDS